MDGTTTAAADTTSVLSDGAADAAADKGGAADAKQVDTSKGVLTGEVQALGQDQKDTKASDVKADPAKAEADKGKVAELEVKFGELQVDEQLAGKFKATAKELGLDSAKAQKVADLYVEAQKASETKSKEGIAALDKQWADTLKADKEIGGAKLNESVLLARKALNRFGGPELTADLEKLGLTNLPSLVKAFVKAGRAIAEDSISTTNKSAATKAADPDAQFRAQYPSMFNEDGSRKGSGANS